VADQPSPPKDFNFLDMKVAMEGIFQGCTVEMGHGLGTASAEVRFGEFEVRVMLTGHGKANWVWHVRFQQQVELPDRKRPTKPIKRTLHEVQSKDPQEAVAALKHVKAYLLGLVHSIQAALRPKAAVEATEVGDIFRGRD